MLSAMSIVSAKDFVVVIDPGHGGHDYGAIGLKTNEKTINLKVALALGDMINNGHDDVKVVYTRSSDTFLTLRERANRANHVSGDLFISIHTNSLAKKNKKRKTITGASTYTLGLHRTAENLEVAKRENSVMVLEEDYSTTYSGFDPNSTESYIIFELNQNKHMEQSIDFASKVQKYMVSIAGRLDRGVRQAGFWVLANTGMPAVLVELDFICNPTAEKFLASSSGQKKFAKSIYQAFCDYKEAYNHSMGLSTDIDNVAIVNDEKTLTHDVDDKQLSDQETEIGKLQEIITYKIQILASDKKIAKGSTQFKGLTPIGSYFEGGLYKYTYGNYAEWNDAVKELKRVKRKFPEAFIIKLNNGKRIK